MGNFSPSIIDFFFLKHISIRPHIRALFEEVPIFFYHSIKEAVAMKGGSRSPILNLPSFLSVLSHFPSVDCQLIQLELS